MVSQNCLGILMAIALILSAEALSLRKSSRVTNNRRLLRLEKAPYPAAGFKPDIPFELPTEIETTTPVNLEETTTPLPLVEVDVTTEQQSFVPSTYLPPQQPQDVYGPPEQPQDTYGPPREDSQPDIGSNIANSSPEIEQLDEQEFETLPQPEPRTRSGRLSSFGRKLKKPIK